MKKYFLILLIMPLYSLIGRAQTYTFNCDYHSDKKTIPAVATLSVEQINNGVKYGKCLQLDVRERNSSKLLMATNTDPCNGVVFCRSVTDKDNMVEFIGDLKYRWLFIFETDYPNGNSITFQIGVVYHTEIQALKDISHIRINSFFNYTSTHEWITTDFNNKTWLDIVNIISSFEKVGTYSNWQKD